MAVVVLPLPLEQLKTKAERESSAKVLFMASRSLSKSCNQDHKSLHCFLSIHSFLLHATLKSIKKNRITSNRTCAWF